jgi:hypothetical protein
LSYVNWVHPEFAAGIPLAGQVPPGSVMLASWLAASYLYVVVFEPSA